MGLSRGSQEHPGPSQIHHLSRGQAGLPIHLLPKAKGILLCPPPCLGARAPRAALPISQPGGPVGSVKVCEETGFVSSGPGATAGPEPSPPGPGGREPRGPALQFCPFLGLLGRKPSSEHCGQYLLHSRAKPGLWLGKRELGRQSWRRGRAGARGGLQILSGSIVIIATHLPRGWIPPRAWDSCYRLFPPRLLHYVGRSLSRPPLNFCPRFPGPSGTQLSSPRGSG